MAKIIRDSTGDCSYDGGHTWQKCPTNLDVTNIPIMNISPSLQNLVANVPDTWAGIANFVVDNNPTGVFAVLRGNGYNFNTEGEAAIIVKSILLGSTTKQKSELDQLAKVPYLNNATNGTGGLKAPIGAATTAGIGDDLLCTVGTLFGYPISCSTTAAQPTAQQLAQQKAAADEAAAQQKKTAWIVGGTIGAITLILIGIYLINKSKQSKPKQ